MELRRAELETPASRRSLRILMLAKDFPAPGQPEGGIVVLRQALALVHQGYDVRVARVVPWAPRMTAKWRSYGAIPSRYDVDGIAVQSVRAIFAPRMATMEFLPVQINRAIGRIVEDFKPDVLHAHCLIPSGHLAAYQPVPTVVTAHGSDAYDWPWRRAGLQRAAALGVRSADAVVAVSDFIRDNVCRLFQRDVDVIFNGADEGTFSPDGRAQARLALGIDGDRFVVACVGRPPEAKGALDLARAAAEMTAVRPLLLFAGPDPSDPSLLRAIEQHRVEARICGMLDREALARLLRAANVFCLPSYREGLPLAICEAMLSGRPIVATPVGGIPEVVSDGVQGFLVPAGDARAIARKLMVLARNPQLAHSMGEAARRFACERLTWRANVTSYGRIYRRLANEPRVCRR